LNETALTQNIELKTMYPGKAYSPHTTLAQAISAEATEIEVADASALPPAPNIAVIGTNENAETIVYTEKTGNLLRGIIRGVERPDEARAWNAGALVARNIAKLDLDAIQENIGRLLAGIEQLDEAAAREFVLADQALQALKQNLTTAIAKEVEQLDQVIDVLETTLTEKTGEIEGELDTHVKDNGNPHGVTAEQVGADPAGTAQKLIDALPPLSGGSERDILFLQNGTFTPEVGRQYRIVVVGGGEPGQPGVNRPAALHSMAVPHTAGGRGGGRANPVTTLWTAPNANPIPITIGNSGQASSFGNILTGMTGNASTGGSTQSISAFGRFLISHQGQSGITVSNLPLPIGSGGALISTSNIPGPGHNNLPGGHGGNGAGGIAYSPASMAQPGGRRTGETDFEGASGIGGNHGTGCGAGGGGGGGVGAVAWGPVSAANAGLGGSGASGCVIIIPQ